MTYDKLKLPTAIIAALLPLSGAMAENYDGQDLTGQTLNTTNSMSVGEGWSFIGTNLTNATFAPLSGSTLTISNIDFSNADFTGTTFTNVSFKGGINFSGNNITYEQFITGARALESWNVNLSNMDLTGWTILKRTNNGVSNLDITDSIINGAQLYFKNEDISIVDKIATTPTIGISFFQTATSA